jgi:hypothetical protein
MRETIDKPRVEPAEALPQFQFKRQTLNAAIERQEKDPLSVNTGPSAPSNPDSQRSPAAGGGREPVLAAAIAFLVLSGIVIGVGAVGYETLNLGATSESRWRPSPTLAVTRLSSRRSKTPAFTPSQSSKSAAMS